MMHEFRTPEPDGQRPAFESPRTEPSTRGPTSPAAASRPPASPPRPARERATFPFSRLLWVLSLLAVLLAAPLVAERVQYAITRGQQRAKADFARTQLASLQDTGESFRLVAQCIGPAVVHIDAQRAAEELSPSEDEEDRSGFFHRSRPIRRGQGAGVIVDEEGYVITNYHVIERATRITVKLSDGRRIKDVRVVGVDRLTDLAVLKIGASGLTHIPWGKSEDLEVGDWVLAMGNPFGLDRTVTAGIISAKHRGADLPRSYFQDFLQTDAAVNPGNSGGPLVNLKAELVGINTAIVGETFQGVSFAVPSEIARVVYQRLLAEGKVARGWLGVLPQEVSSELAEQLGIEARRGALLGRVVEDSPAHRAGLRVGDVILRWGEKQVDSPHNLRLLVAGSEIGSTVQVVIWRDGARSNLDVEVQERPND